MIANYRRTIHLVMFSRLQSHDGGRETWLSNFIAESKRVNSDFNLLVYYYSDSLSLSRRLIESMYLYPELFINIEIPNQGNIVRSLLRVVKFQFKVFTKVYRSIQSNDIVLGIGNLHEAAIPFTFSKIPFNKKIHSGIWLRSIFVKQQAALAGPTRLKIMTAIEIRLLRSLSFVLSNGWDTAEFYKKSYGLDSFVIPNSLVLSKYKDIVKFDPEKRNLVVSFIGRLSKEKGFVEFVDSVNVFNNQFSEYSASIEFQVVGDGPLLYLLDKNKHKNLKYIGVLANELVPEYLGSIDCGVALTSSSSIGGGGLSHGYLELLASGRIVIVWDNSIYTQIDCKDAAILIDEGDVFSLATSYLNVLKDREFYKTKTTNAIILAESFSIHNHMSSFTRFVENV